MATLTDLRNDTLILLNEVGTIANNPVGALPDGSGGTDVVTTTVTIDQFINEAAAEMARSCVYIPTTLSLTGFTGSVASLATSSIWFPMSVSVAGSLLQHTSDLRLRAWQPNFETFSGTLTLPNGGTTTSPTYWYRREPQTVGIFPAVASSSAVSIYGAGLPPATGIYVTSPVGGGSANIGGSFGNVSLVVNQPVYFTTTTTLPSGLSLGTTYYILTKTATNITVSTAIGGAAVTIAGAIPAGVHSLVADSLFAPDDVLRNTLPVYAAYKLAMKNLDDPSLAARIQLWQQWWFDSTQRLWNQLDSSLKMEGSPYASPPVAPPAVK